MSGEWFGEIPQHWESQRIKTLFNLRDERSYLALDEVNLISLYANVGVRQHSDIEHTTGNKARNADGYKIVRPNDIIVNILLCWMGAIGRSDYDGVTSPAYDVYAPKKDVNSRYYHYLFRIPLFSQQCYKVGKGIMAMRWRTYSPQFRNIIVPIPPRDEQEQIVRFLDWKVSAINRLIAGRKKQLTLIQELVNKQFMQIAAGAFQQAKIKYCVSLCNDFIEIDKERQYLKTGMYNRGRGIFRRPPLLGADMGDSSFQKIFSGCVMISGQFAWEAATYITTSEDEIGVASHRYYLLKPREEIPAEYIWCFLMSDYGQMQMKLCSHGAAGRNRPLNIKELLDVYMPIPVWGKDLDNLIRNVHTLMEMRNNIDCQEKSLAEFRARLISDVVTGKIDVRGVEVPEYETVEEETDEEETVLAEEEANEQA